MIEYISRHYDDLLEALIEHLTLVGITLVISLVLAAILVVLCNYSKILGNILVNVFSVIYSIPSLALVCAAYSDYRAWRSVGGHRARHLQSIPLVAQFFDGTE